MKNSNHFLILLLIGLFSCSLFGQEQLEVEGAIIIKNSVATTPTPGTIRWTGADFEGWNGQRWISLTGYAIAGTITDIDGNTYQTSRIGVQEWMVENLRVTRYNDNTVVDQITNNATWSGLSTAAWCWYNNDNNYEVPYGKLYNWYAVNSTKLCPTGWHVPCDAEWTTLTDYLGWLSTSGGKMKETGLDHWSVPNTGATNESGFTGLPGGYRFGGGTFHDLFDFGLWWSRTESSSTDAWYRLLYYDEGSVGRTSNEKIFGFSVRCVRN